MNVAERKRYLHQSTAAQSPMLEITIAKYLFVKIKNDSVRILLSDSSEESVKIKSVKWNIFFNIQINLWKRIKSFKTDLKLIRTTSRSICRDIFFRHQKLVILVLPVPEMQIQCFEKPSLLDFERFATLLKPSKN